MNSFASARRATGRIARTAATAALSLALAVTMVPANAFAAPESWGGVQR